MAKKKKRIEPPKSPGGGDEPARRRPASVASERSHDHEDVIRYDFLFVYAFMINKIAVTSSEL